jgi:hypothetical protein
MHHARKWQRPRPPSLTRCIGFIGYRIIGLSMLKFMIRARPSHCPSPALSIPSRAFPTPAQPRTVSPRRWS